MVLSEDAEDTLFKKHQELGIKLNLDPITITQAWETYQNIRSKYTLEGDPVHWLGCALFVACRLSTTPTIGQTVVEGNCVNLTSLLRNCNLSLAQFFDKIKKWCDMAKMGEDFRRKIDILEGNFAVSYNVFKKYVVTFSEIFKSPTDVEQSKHHRNRKQRAVPCNSTKVFEFIWNLFVTLKGQYLSCSADLVVSVQLLFACCDLAFKNAFLANRRDLLNPEFKGLPPNWNNSDFVVTDKAPCIIDKILEANSTMETDAKYMKTYHLKQFLTILFNNGTLQGNKRDFSGLFEPAVFDANFNNIIRAYEVHLLNKGDFDERIFLAEYRRRTLIQSLNNSLVTNSPYSADASVTSSPRIHQFGEQPPPTPLTGRKYLGPREQNESNTLLTVSNTIARLHSLLGSRGPAPSDALLQIFRSCSADPTEKVKEIVQQLGDKFLAKYLQQSTNSSEIQTDYANKRLELAVTLFYKLVENILQYEKTIQKDISALVEKTIFYECVLACSLEIVIYAHNSQVAFPWILQALCIQPYNFLKVIELIVRTKDQLPRNVVKHLNWVEETIIESLAWETDSQLWEDIKKWNKEIPKFEDIALPGSIVYTQTKPTILNNENNIHLSSPNPSAVDTFQSPITSNQVKKQLFPVTKSTHIVLTGKDGNKQVIALAESEPEQQTQASPENTPSKPKIKGSLAIFFRKFYNLAGVRMEDLCNRLGISDVELKRKIWTAFEYSVRGVTELMRDRHLDQLLMCAVYVVCKVTRDNDINFWNIMKCYRSQPQAKSHIYRSVLLRKIDDQVTENNEPIERGDLISFYNRIYVDVMTNFIKKLTNKTVVNSDILLSPLPAPKPSLVSPKLQIVKNVFVKPYDSPSNVSNGKSYNYYFSRSPSKDLRDINKAINSGVSGKRLLVDGDVDMPNKKIAQRKVQSLIEERKSQNME